MPKGVYPRTKTRTGPNHGVGKGALWIKAHATYDGDDCLPWPFSIDKAYGRGRVGFEGELYWSHNLMCRFVYGPPPTPKHQATHSCGNGHLACMNPKHLAWKTNSQNQFDRRKHGTTAGGKGSRTRLTPEQVEEIRRLKGIETQFSLADRFRVKRGCIEYWQRTDHDPNTLSDDPRDIARRKRRAA